MCIKAVLFDLDGTLLPMDQDVFAKAYIGGLVKTAAKHGYDLTVMTSAIMRGTAAMVKNSGDMTNEELFWKTLSADVGEKILAERDIFDSFYATDFQRIAELCGKIERAGEIIDIIKARGLRVALATNPLFPTVATESRIRWAGLSPDSFELFTSYETSHYCKPNLDYYREVLSAMRIRGEECVMVGNDVGEDMIAERLGMKVFLLTDCMINRANADISAYPKGGADELIEFINSL